VTTTRRIFKLKYLIKLVMNRVLSNQRKQVLLKFSDVVNSYTSKIHGTKVLQKYKNWFPIKASPRLAGIVADLMGDDHLQGDPRWRIDYTSKRVTELKRFNNEIKLMFGVKGKIREGTTNIYKTKNLGINNGPLTRVLNLLGTPTGIKLLKNLIFLFESRITRLVLVDS